MLSLAQSSPLPEPYRRHGFGRSCSSVGSSAESTGTVQHHRLRSLSRSSLSSLTSLWAPAFRRQEDNTASRSSSSHNLPLRRIPTSSNRRSGSDFQSRRTSFASVLSSRLRSEPSLVTEQNEPRLLEVAESDGEIPEPSEDDGDSVGEPEVEQPDIVDDTPTSTTPAVGFVEVRDTNETRAGSSAQPGFRRWISTLRKRKKPKKPAFTPRSSPWKFDGLGSMPTSPAKQPITNHKKSDSLGSSLAFVTAVKSATATIASVSIATISRRNTRWQRSHQHSSVISGSDARPSIDSQRSVIDEAAKQRSRKRRDKLEELIHSEESYVADIKALLNVRILLPLPDETANSSLTGVFYHPGPSTNLGQLCKGFC